MKKYTALVVDDSAFMRKMITDIINQSRLIEVISTARNGEDALEKVEKWKPDVVTMDVEMPIMDGITTLTHMMEKSPTPVVMLSSLTKIGADKTMEAMSLGAVDFIAKPSGSISLNIKEIQQEIISKVEQAVVSNISTFQKREKAKSVSLDTESRFLKRNRPMVNPIIAIGSSTGGPRALQEIITNLPSDFKAPIVVVQHMPKGFTKSLADRLNKLSNVEVKEVENGDLIEKGKVYIAEGGKQFEVIGNGAELIAKVSKREPVNGHQPSVDVLFGSIARLPHCHPLSIILTGMGKDGSNGIVQLKQRHPRTITISQSKETCVVYGMPQAAERTSLVDYVLDIQDISTILQEKA